MKLQYRHHRGGMHPAAAGVRQAGKAAPEASGGSQGANGQHGCFPGGAGGDAGHQPGEFRQSGASEQEYNFSR